MEVEKEWKRIVVDKSFTSRPMFMGLTSWLFLAFLFSSFFLAAVAVFSGSFFLLIVALIIIGIIYLVLRRIANPPKRLTVDKIVKSDKYIKHIDFSNDF